MKQFGRDKKTLRLKKFMASGDVSIHPAFPGIILSDEGDYVIIRTLHRGTTLENYDALLISSIGLVLSRGTGYVVLDESGNRFSPVNTYNTQIAVYPPVKVLHDMYDGTGTVPRPSHQHSFAKEVAKYVYKKIAADLE
jgi:hypothetical protein